MENKQIKLNGRLEEGGTYVFSNGEFHPTSSAGGTTTFEIPRPGRQFFANSGDITEHLMQQAQPVFELDDTVSPGTDHVGIAYPETGGTFVYLKGLLFPTKGFPHPEALQAANIAKRCIAIHLTALMRNPLHLLSMLRKKNLELWIQEMNHVGDMALGAYYPADIRMSVASRAIGRFIEQFLLGMGLSSVVGFSRIIATIFEYDNAYMLRLQDLANETTAEALCKNPEKEFVRLFAILKQRDQRTSMHRKVWSIMYLLKVAFWIPRIKKAFVNAIKSIDWKDVQMDDGDRYQALRWITYDFFGQTFEERAKRLYQMHEGKLPQAMILQS